MNIEEEFKNYIDFNKNLCKKKNNTLIGRILELFDNFVNYYNMENDKLKFNELLINFLDRLNDELLVSLINSYNVCDINYLLIKYDKQLISNYKEYDNKLLCKVILANYCNKNNNIDYVKYL